MHGLKEGPRHWQPERRRHFHVVCRAPEFDDPDAHAPLHPPTNAFSKKVENHAHAVALHMMYYNFVRIHKTLRVTPAMAAGVSDRLWEIGDIAALVAATDEAPKKRGPYKKPEA